MSVAVSKQPFVPLAIVGTTSQIAMSDLSRQAWGQAVSFVRTIADGQSTPDIHRSLEALLPEIKKSGILPLRVQALEWIVSQISSAPDQLKSEDLLDWANRVESVLQFVDRQPAQEEWQQKWKELTSVQGPPVQALYRNGTNGHANGNKLNGVQARSEKVISRTNYQATVVFTDLTGFSTLSQGQSPEYISERIELYMGRLQPIITRRGGTIIKTIGDAIMACFKELRKSAVTAVQTGVLLQKELKLINEELRRTALQSVDAAELLKALGKGDVHEVSTEDIKKLMENDQLYTRQVEYMLSEKRYHKKLEELNKEQIVNLFVMKIDPLIADQRVGLESGEVVEQTYADGRRDLSGEVVNTANRMEAECPIGGVLMGKGTYEHCLHDFEFVAEVKKVKGMGHLPTFSVVREISAVEKAARLAQSRLSIQGRDEEIKRLRSLFEDCISNKKAQMVMIEGGAGEGKTALVYEFTSSLKGVDHHLYEVRCQDFAVTDSYQVFLEMLRNAMNIDESSDPEIQRKRVQAFLSDIFVDDERAGMIADEVLSQYLGCLVGNESAEFRVIKETGELKNKFYGIIVRIFKTLCHNKAVIIKIDDIQWADEGTLELLQFLLNSLENEPLLVLAPRRREIIERDNDGGVGRPLSKEADVEVKRWESGPFKFEKLELNTLSVAASEAMIREIMAENVTPELIAWIGDKAGTHPMYVRSLAEELMRRHIGTVRDAEESVRVPKEIRGFLESLIGESSPEEQRLLKYAAIIGRRFRTDDLIKLGFQNAEGTIGSLVAQNFILRIAEGEYQFRHDLRREAVLAQMVNREKQEVNAAYADYLVKSGSKKFRQIASHFESGGRSEEASEYYRLSAEDAFSRRDFVEAASTHKKAFSLAKDKNRKFKILRGWDEAYVASKVYQGTETIYYEARLLLGGEGDLSRVDEAGIHYRRGRSLNRTKDYSKALDELQTALKILEEPGQHREREDAKRLHISILIELAQYFSASGIHNDSLNLYEQAAKLARKSGDKIQLGRALGGINHIAGKIGDYEKTLTVSREIVEVFLEANDELRAISALAGLGSSLLMVGAYEEAEKVLMRAKSLASDFGDNVWNVEVLFGNLGRLAYFQSRSKDSIHWFESALSKDNITPQFIPILSVSLSLAYLLDDRMEKAESIAKSILKLSIEKNDQESEAMAHMALAQVLLKKDRPNEALEVIERAYYILREKTVEEFDLEILLTYAQTLIILKKDNEALSIIEEAKSELDRRAANINHQAYSKSLCEEVEVNRNIVRLRQELNARIVDVRSLSEFAQRKLRKLTIHVPAVVPDKLQFMRGSKVEDDIREYSYKEMDDKKGKSIAFNSAGAVLPLSVANVFGLIEKADFEVQENPAGMITLAGYSIPLNEILSGKRVKWKSFWAENRSENKDEDPEVLSAKIDFNIALKEAVNRSEVVEITIGDQRRWREIVEDKIEASDGIVTIEFNSSSADRVKQVGGEEVFIGNDKIRPPSIFFGKIRLVLMMIDDAKTALVIEMQDKLFTQNPKNFLQALLNFITSSSR